MMTLENKIRIAELGTKIADVMEEITMIRIDNLTGDTDLTELELACNDLESAMDHLSTFNS